MTSPRIAGNRERAESFGADAGAYDRARPSYPAALVADLLDLTPKTVLDVGCGTGIASRLIVDSADRGNRPVDLLGVEVDSRMAEVARRRGVEVEVGSFEDWNSRGRQFDLVMSAQAWHWIDPILGPAKAADVLTPGGHVALFWNFVVIPAPARDALDEAYAMTRVDVSPLSVVRGGGPSTLDAHIRDLDPGRRFGPVERREYDWPYRYNRDGWLNLIATHSDHLRLTPAQRSALFGAVGNAIDRLGGSLDVTYRTFLLLSEYRRATVD